MNYDDNDDNDDGHCRHNRAPVSMYDDEVKWSEVNVSEFLIPRATSYHRRQKNENGVSKESMREGVKVVATNNTKQWKFVSPLLPQQAQAQTTTISSTLLLVIMIYHHPHWHHHSNTILYQSLSLPAMWLSWCYAEGRSGRWSSWELTLSINIIVVIILTGRDVNPTINPPKTCEMYGYIVRIFWFFSEVSDRDENMDVVDLIRGIYSRMPPSLRYNLYSLHTPVNQSSGWRWWCRSINTVAVSCFPLDTPLLLISPSSDTIPVHDILCLCRDHHPPGKVIWYGWIRMLFVWRGIYLVCRASRHQYIRFWGPNGSCPVSSNVDACPKCVREGGDGGDGGGDDLIVYYICMNYSTLVCRWLRFYHLVCQAGTNELDIIIDTIVWVLSPGDDDGCPYTVLPFFCVLAVMIMFLGWYGM